MSETEVSSHRGQRWRRLALAIVLAPFLLIALFWRFQGILVFHPIPGSPGHTPAELGLDYESVSLETRDGETLSAWWIPQSAGASDQADCAILYLHGNAGNLGHRMPALRGLAPLGCALLLPDYRGYGESTGHPDEAGLYTDAHAAWTFLRKQRGYEASAIAVWGRSLGGGPAAELAAEVHPGALIMEATFTSIKEVGRHHYPDWLIDRFGQIDFDSRSRLEGYADPLLVATSPEDRLIPHAQGRALFEVAGGDAAGHRFVKLSGSHNAGHLTLPRYESEIRSFLQSSGLLAESTDS